jgi:hypothetical protein
VSGDPYNLRDGETAAQFGERIKALHTAPSWAEMRSREDHADSAYRFLSSAPFNECRHAHLQTDKVRRCLCFEPKALGGEGR